jgi:hypothetical protein
MAPSGGGAPERAPCNDPPEEKQRLHGAGHTVFA